MTDIPRDNDSAAEKTPEPEMHPEVRDFIDNVDKLEIMHELGMAADFFPGFFAPEADGEDEEDDMSIFRAPR